MPDRYAAMFAMVRAEHRRALVPFVTLGDPSPATSATILRALVDAGADALELGVPFSDPVADGPVLQAAAVRARHAGTRLSDCFALAHELRCARAALPIGMLVYANTVVACGVAAFYASAAAAGVDSVLVADLPLLEGAPFEAAAHAAGVAPVFIAPPQADGALVHAIASRGRGYTYVTSRRGVTGGHDTGHEALAARIASLHAAGAAPAVVGFGISTPDDVRAACAAGASGVIVGTALVQRIAAGVGARDIAQFVRSLASATRSRVAHSPAA